MKKTVIYVVFCMAMMLGLCACGKGPTINLNDYLIVETDGYDGYGTVKFEIDYDSIIEKYGSKMQFTQEAKEDYMGLLNLMKPSEFCSNQYIKVSDVSKGPYSNGDTIEYEWDVEKFTKYVKCNVKYTNSKVKVSGLKEVVKFDAFADLTVTFSGVSKNGKVDTEYKGSESGIRFSASKSYNLANGDVVTITISPNTADQWMKSYGKVPEIFTKDYTVSGLNEYVSTFSEISGTEFEKLKKDAEDTLKAYAARTYTDNYSLNSMEYDGYVFQTLKNGSGSYGYSNNKLYIIFMGELKNKSDDSTTTVFYPVSFSDLLVAEGVISTEYDAKIEGSFSFGLWTSSYGYTNPITCYKDLVSSYVDSYDIEYSGTMDNYSDIKAVSSLSEIDKEEMEFLHEHALSTIKKYTATYDSSAVLTEFVLAGEYLLVAKKQDSNYESSNSNNKYFAVYSATLSSSENKFKTAVVYYPVEYDGILSRKDGTCIAISTNGIVGSSRLESNSSWMSWGTKGYIDGEKMFSEIVTANIDKYTYEISEGLRQFGE
jgi:hypothetical protein